MTRINLIPPHELETKHLVAEYREIMRLPNNLKKSLTRKKPFSTSEIPNEYTLGTGHVKFFYNKMQFLQKRFESLVQEMINRGFSPKYTDSSIFIPEDLSYYSDYNPNKSEIDLNKHRINERLGNKEIK